MRVSNGKLPRRDAHRQTVKPRRQSTRAAKQKQLARCNVIDGNLREHRLKAQEFFLFNSLNVAARELLPYRNEAHPARPGIFKPPGRSLFYGLKFFKVQWNSSLPAGKWERLKGPQKDLQRLRFRPGPDRKKNALQRAETSQKPAQ